MPLIDVEALTAEISPEAPCGEDISYDPAFSELDRIAQGTQEQVMGDEVIAAEEPNWSDVARRSLELLARSRDLRVLTYLILAALKVEGLTGLRDGLAVLRRLIETRWDTFYPLLDPEDDNDPTERVNIIEAISQPSASSGQAISPVANMMSR
ncbi:ImpA family type VI secretion system protein [Planctomycetota bacterium]